MSSGLLVFIFFCPVPAASIFIIVNIYTATVQLLVCIFRFGCFLSCIFIAFVKSASIHRMDWFRRGYGWELVVVFVFSVFSLHLPSFAHAHINLMQQSVDRCCCCVARLCQKIGRLGGVYGDFFFFSQSSVLFASSYSLLVVFGLFFFAYSLRSNRSFWFLNLGGVRF